MGVLLEEEYCSLLIKTLGISMLKP